MELINGKITFGCPSPFQQTPSTESEQILTVPELDLLKCYSEDNGQTINENIWTDKRSEVEIKSKRKIRKNRRKGDCQLLRIIRIIKENLKNLLRTSPKTEVYNTFNSCMSTESTYVLAHLSAKLLELEGRLLRHLDCTQDNGRHIAYLMKNVRENIILQLICGPCNNVALRNCVQECAYIECLLEYLEKRIHYGSKNKHLDEVTKVGDNCESDAVTDSKCSCIDKSVNTEKNEIEIFCCPCVQKVDKSINCEQCNTIVSNQNICPKKMLYTYRKENGTKKTEFEKCQLNLKYYYDVCQMNKCTSTIDAPNNILLPIKNYMKDCYCQTDPCSLCKSCIEITTITVSYKNELQITTLDKLPRLTDITKDYFMMNFDEEIENDGGKIGIRSYATKINDGNYCAQTNTNINAQELTLIYNDNPTESDRIDGASLSNVDLKLKGFTKEIINGVKQVAVQVLCDFISQRS